MTDDRHRKKSSAAQNRDFYSNQVGPNSQRTAESRLMRRTGQVLLTVLLMVAAVSQVQSAEKMVSQRYEEALSLYQKGDFLASVTQLKNGLQTAPRHLPSRILLARAYLAQGFGADAEREIKKAATEGADKSLTVPVLAAAYLRQFMGRRLLKELQPDGLTSQAKEELLLVRAEAYLNMGDNPSAIDTFHQAEVLVPGGSRALVGRALVALRQGQLEVAVQLSEKAVRFNADDSAALTARAIARQFQGNLLQALDDYDKAIKLTPALHDARIGRIALLLRLGRDDEADADLRYEAQQNRTDPRGAYLHVIRLAREGDTAGAGAVLSDVNSLVKRMDPEWVANNVQLLGLAGIANYGLGAFELAHRYFDMALAASPRSVSFRKILAATNLSLHAPDSALKVLEDADSDGPQDIPILTLRAQAWMMKGGAETALRLLKEVGKLPKTVPGIQTAIALNDLSRGKIDQAQAGLTAVLHDAPSNVRANLMMAVLDEQRGDYQAADAIAKKLLGQAPDNLVLLNLSASARAGLGDRITARRSLAQCLIVQPKFAIASINLSRLDVAEGHYDAARLTLQTALKDDPASSEISLDLAKLEDNTGNHEAAIRVLEKSRTATNNLSLAERDYLIKLLLEAKDLDRAKTEIVDAKVHFPKNIRLLQWEVQLLEVRGEPERARGPFKEMTDLAGDDTTGLTRIALQQIAFRLPEDARYTVAKAQRADPDFLPAWVVGADLAMKRGDKAAAAQQIKEITDREPDAPVVARLAGDYALLANDATTALVHFHRFYGLNPSPFAMARVASALMSVKRFSEAARWVADWLNTHPKDEAAQKLLAAVYDADGKRAAARDTLARLINQSPNDSESLNNLAYLSEQTGQPNALEFARRAYALAPESAEINDTLGWILVRHEQPEEGLGYLREAEVRSMQSKVFKYHIAMAHAALHHNRDALTAVTDALEDDTAFAERDDAKTLQAKLAQGTLETTTLGAAGRLGR